MTNIGQWFHIDLDETSSTNDDARILFDKLKKKCIVSAKHQTNGRGRLGRKWESDKGNLFVSFAYPIEIEKIGHYVILSALATFQTVKYFAPNFRTKIKWPNDILIENKKVCGILFEKGEGDCWIMGIGINVQTTPQIQNPIYKMTSFKDFGIQTDRITVLKKLVQNFDTLEALYKKNGFEPIRQSWLDNAFSRAKKVCIQNGKTKTEGILHSLDENGALVLKTSEGTKKIVAGDLYATNNTK